MRGTILAGWLVSLLTVGACATGPSEEVASRSLRDSPPVANLERLDSDIATLIQGLIDEVEAAPAVASKWAALGMAYEVNGLPMEARSCYDEAVAREPDEPRWRYHQALRQAASGELEQAMETMAGVLTERPGYVPGWLYQGSWALDLGRLDDAERAYRTAIDAEDDHPFAHAGMARVLLKQGRVEPALIGLKSVVEQHPRIPYFRQLLGTAYREAGDLERARVELSQVQAGETAPSWPDPWNDARSQYSAGFSAGMIRAEHLFQAGRFSESVQVLEKIRPLRPDDVGLLNNLSATYLRLGRHDEAREVLLAGVETHPDYFPFHINLAVSYRSSGQPDEALRHIERAMEINPTLFAIHSLRAQLLQAEGRLPEALEGYLEAASLEPTDFRLPMLAGIVASQLGRWELSAEQFRRAVEIDARQAPAWIGLGQSLAELGRFDEGEEALERAAGLQPRHPQLPVARERLGSLRAGGS